MTAGLYAKSSGIAAAGARGDRSDWSPGAASGLQLEPYRRISTDRLELRMRLDLCRFAAQVALELRRSQRHAADSRRREEVKSMKRNTALFVLAGDGLFCLDCSGPGNEQYTAPPRHITLQEAVQLALKHNHDIRIAGYTVEEKEHAKQVAKSAYFPSIRNDSSFLHVTDTELIEIKSGSLGIAGGTPIPPADAIINQGGKNFTTSGTQLTQPLTNLLKIRRENDLAQAELKAIA